MADNDVLCSNVQYICKVWNESIRPRTSFKVLIENKLNTFFLNNKTLSFKITPGNIFYESFLVFSSQVWLSTSNSEKYFGHFKTWTEDEMFQQFILIIAT